VYVRRDMLWLFGGGGSSTSSRCSRLIKKMSSLLFSVISSLLNEYNDSLSVNREVIEILILKFSRKA
jgi:hypothetical protein